MLAVTTNDHFPPELDQSFFLSSGTGKNNPEDPV
jgi:hypothetical protein